MGNDNKRVRRFRWGPVDPRARVRWFRLAELIASRFLVEARKNPHRATNAFDLIGALTDPDSWQHRYRACDCIVEKKPKLI